MKKRRIVITGLGAVSCLGIGTEPLWKGVLESRSGIGPIQSFACDGFAVQQGGEIHDFNPRDFVENRKSLKVMSRDIQLACAASALAFQDAQVAPEDVNPERAGVSMGAGLLDNEIDEIAACIRNSLDESGNFQMTKFGGEGIRTLFPLWMLKYLPNMPSCHISIMHNLQGPSNTITTACAAAMQAVGEASRIIERGDADLMAAGGAESRMNPFGLTRYYIFKTLVNGNGVASQAAYRPFDKRRSGFVLGEGAGVLILEELEHALRRKAKIYAEVAGYGSSADFNYLHGNLEDSNGRELAMGMALRDAGISQEQVSLIHAHGSGIPKDDFLEAKAIHRVFGERLAGQIPVVATKPYVGHTGFASGALQMILSSKIAATQQVPATLNYAQQDPEIALEIVARLREDARVEFILTNAFGLSGQNASVLIKKWRGK
ncbi:MAG: beta-ketoacyl-[acyl-carrier-protein] synthase family protein [Candidatus Omnitrophica bacterium]|nr:beta-ketoacyl-[acyl-carrier-protein] synthase family protein [Candidatus Omnitrophota bacterium]